MAQCPHFLKAYRPTRRCAGRSFFPLLLTYISSGSYDARTRAAFRHAARVWGVNWRRLGREDALFESIRAGLLSGEQDQSPLPPQHQQQQLGGALHSKEGSRLAARAGQRPVEHGPLGEDRAARAVGGAVLLGVTGPWPLRSSSASALWAPLRPRSDGHGCARLLSTKRGRAAAPRHLWGLGRRPGDLPHGPAHAGAGTRSASSAWSGQGAGGRRPADDPSSSGSSTAGRSPGPAPHRLLPRPRRSRSRSRSSVAAGWLASPCHWGLGPAWGKATRRGRRCCCISSASRQRSPARRSRPSPVEAEAAVLAAARTLRAAGGRGGFHVFIVVSRGEPRSDAQRAGADPPPPPAASPRASCRTALEPALTSRSPGQPGQRRRSRPRPHPGRAGRSSSSGGSSGGRRRGPRAGAQRPVTGPRPPPPPPLPPPPSAGGGCSDRGGRSPSRALAAQGLRLRQPASS